MIARPRAKRYIRNGERLLRNRDETNNGEVAIQRLVILVRDDNIHRGRISGVIGPLDRVAGTLNPVLGGGRPGEGDGGKGRRGEESKGEESSTHRNVWGELGSQRTRRVESRRARVDSSCIF